MGEFVPDTPLAKKLRDYPQSVDAAKDVPYPLLTACKFSRPTNASIEQSVVHQVPAAFSSPPINLSRSQSAQILFLLVTPFPTLVSSLFSSLDLSAWSRMKPLIPRLWVMGWSTSIVPSMAQNQSTIFCLRLSPTHFPSWPFKAAAVEERS